ncbi:MAG: DciA family protein [Parvularculales bacterium]
MKSLTPYPRPTTMRSVTLSLTPVVRRIFRRHGFTHTSLLTHWAELVGPEIAALAQPESLHQDKHNGGSVLVIRVSGAAAVLIQHDTPRLIARINAVCGPDTVTRLHCVQGAPLPVSPLRITQKKCKKITSNPPSHREGAQLDSSLENISNLGLRENLKRIGQHIMDSALRPPSSP